ncbi:MAG: hypothetical protein ITG02_00315 [Patulibacter sp.]|nr:hypothetical protein [Patulibacter sp.]
MRFETVTFGAVLAGAVTAAAAMPAAVNAAPWITAVETPLVAPVDPAQIRTVTVGDGTVVWVENGPAIGAPLSLRTRDASGLRTVAQIPYVLPQSTPELEVGRTADGSPVVAVTVRTPEGTTIDLVRLTDGQRRRLPSRLRGGKLGGVGIDRGWIYATRTSGKLPGQRASLWRARISGLEVGDYTRIRSTFRTEGWSRIVADRNRVAVLATRSVERGGAFAEESWLVGTPRGRQIRTGENYATEGGYEPLLVAGFTKVRGAVITVRNDTYAPSPAKLQRVLLRGEDEQSSAVQVMPPMLGEAETIAFDGADDRLVAVGPDAATGIPALGTATVPWGSAGR